MSVCDQALQVPGIVAQVRCDAAWVAELTRAKENLALVGQCFDDAGVGRKCPISVDNVECYGCALGSAIAICAFCGVRVDLAEGNDVGMN